MPQQATPTDNRTRNRVPRTTHRTPRLRLLAAALTCAAALTLTACQDGEGLRDEGPATGAAADGYGIGEAPARSHAEPPSGNS